MSISNHNAVGKGLTRESEDNTCETDYQRIRADPQGGDIIIGRHRLCSTSDGCGVGIDKDADRLCTFGSRGVIVDHGLGTGSRGRC